MATRSDYRTTLKNKLLSLEDGGYGDFDYTDAEYNDFLDLAVSKLYPSLFKKVSQTNLSATIYGTNSFGSITPTLPERVYLVVTHTEKEQVRGWSLVGTDLVGFDTLNFPGETYDVYYTDAYALADDDITDLGLPAQYKPLVILGALIEALEARQDTGVRGDEPPTGQFTETQLLDRLIPRYERLRDDMAMALPMAQN